MVEDWLANEEGKIILFTSFVSLIEIFSKEMDKRGINHILYTGGMRRREREDNIHLFKNASNDTRVALISTKAGGVGLNLTVANKVSAPKQDSNSWSDDHARGRWYRWTWREQRVSIGGFGGLTVLELQLERSDRKAGLGCEYLAEDDCNGLLKPV